jgi:16S rRNA (uracil1498-N3)-methyltransferase
MKKLFVDNNILKKGDKVYIEGNDFHHLANVLRVNAGETFIIGDMKNNEFAGIVKEINKKNVVFELENVYEREKYNSPKVTLFFSLLKGDKNEYVVQKCSEIGVDAFVPVVTKNSIIKIDSENAIKKVEKLKSIARETSMQCGRYKIPEIFPITGFENIKKYDINNTLRVFGYISENAKTFYETLLDNKNIENIYIFVGPEGDFTSSESKYLLENNWKGVKLVQNILKSDTASVFMCSSVFFLMERGLG